MSFLLRGLVRHAVRKIASDPRVREKAAEAGRTLTEEARQIARAEDRPRAAGRSVRRALNRLRGYTSG